MTAEHYDEELLLDLSAAGAEVLAHDEHLRACAKCRETLASLNGIASALRSEDVWDGPELNPTPNAQVLATLRAAQSRLQSEDTAAEEFVKHLLAGDRETWSPRLAAHPEWRTAGTVRKLIAATDRAIETMPPDALEIANLAVAIAEGLAPDETFNVHRLRAHAWREKAYALIIAGAFKDAEAAVSHAFENLEHVDAAAAAFDGARAELIRALIARAQEKYSDAIAGARGAAAVFATYAQTDRYVAARRVEALTHYATKHFREEIAILKELESFSVDERDRAAMAQNIAIAYAEMRDFEAAKQHLSRAITELSRLNMQSGRAKAKWSLARMLMSSGEFPRALEELIAARTELQELGMLNDVAMSSLDIAETYIAMGRDADAASVCAALPKYFEAAGLAATSGAMTAISFLKETVASGRATRSVVTHVRHFIENAPKQPARLFVPPPDLG